MTIAEVAKATVEALGDWAQLNRGSAHVAGDVVEMIEILRSRPGAPKCAIRFVSEDVRGEHDELGRVDRLFRVVVARGRGFKIESGESLTDGVAGGKPMFDLAEEVREIVRGLVFDLETTEGRAEYKGMREFEVQGIVMDAYEVSFAVGCQLPMAEW